MRRVERKQPRDVYSCLEDAEWVDIDSIHLWAGNPRRNDSSAAKLAEKIRTHGFRVPIIAWRENMTAYVGNTRLKAARIIGMTRVPVSFQDFESEADAVSFALAENRSSEAASWDEAKLVDRFAAELEAVDVDELEATTGFTQDEVAGLREGLAPLNAANDPSAEWEGMPDYEHKDQQSMRNIIVHFKSDEDAEAFGRLIEQTVTEKTRSLWFPPDEIGTIADKRYSENGEALDEKG